MGDLFWEGDEGLTIVDNSLAQVEVTADPGVYELRLTADNGFGCVASDTLNLTFLNSLFCPLQ